jgi:hypothetical protein
VEGCEFQLSDMVITVCKVSHGDRLIDEIKNGLV